MLGFKVFPPLKRTELLVVDADFQIFKYLSQ
jgi:hypothetical protein